MNKKILLMSFKCLQKHIAFIFLIMLLSCSTFANNILVENIITTGLNETDNYTMVQFKLSWENSWRNSYNAVYPVPNNYDAAWVFVKYKVAGNYASSAGAISPSTGTDEEKKVIQVSSTTGLRVGMPVSVTTEGGEFAPGTVVTAINVDGLHFTVSAVPTTPLTGGTTVVTGYAIWQHATINTTGFTAPTGSTIKPASDGTGAFIYRDTIDTGTNTFTDAKLRWNYGADGVADGASVAIKVFAIEMVYVPQGDFQVGSGGTESGSFTNGSWSGTPGTTPTIPLSIASENALTIANTAGNLWGTSTTGISTIGYAGTLSATFPKGFQAFYCMKYEIMQQQYVDFLNTLTTLQASHRYSASSTGFRYGITLSGEVYSNTTTPYVACNYLNWADLAAYLDWSGLRPMTELEFEKSCRGTLAPVADEYAWGSTSITQNTGITRDGYYDETSENSGNCTYGTHSSVLCPMRVGAFATSSSTTSVLSGATYYGIMEMSGNLYERPVTIGNVAGRSFTGLHGDGTLNTSGDATVNYWPGINGNAISTNPNEVYGGTTGVTSAAGAGIRGGHWNTSEINLRVSDRSSAAEHPDINRWTEFGGRGVRTAP